jgi:hypothetical protein
MAAPAPEQQDTSAQSASLSSRYAPGQERPLASYAILTGIYGGALGGCLAVLRARGHKLPERFTAADALMVGIATHKLSRLIAKDRVTSFLRAPFTRYQEPGGPGEVEEEARGHGLSLVVGELLICPYCLAQWVATGLTVGLVGAPRLTRLLSTIFVAHTIADFLQVAYSAAEDKL